MRTIHISGCFAALLWLLWGCATPTAPEGGPRDTMPPRIDTVQSTPNEQVNFVKQPIVLTFDEWVQLEDAANQVLVSPPLEFRPQIRIRRRSVVFDFDSREQLRPNVTYAVSYGTAIRDLTERNAAEDVRFVFSTGPTLDSLTIEGVLKDAATGQPLEKALFMLYENRADSVVRKERPLYYGKTDKEGRFRIRNIREGTFKGFALAEVNNNYRYDVPNEKIGFPEGEIAITGDSLQRVELLLFTESPPLRRTAVDSSRAGALKIAFNQRPLLLRPALEDQDAALYQALDKDTLLVWFDPAFSGNLLLQRDSTFFDTIPLPVSNPARALPEMGYNPPPGAGPLRQHPAEDFVLLCTAPLLRLDTGAIALLEDTLLQPVRPKMFIDTTDARLLHIHYPWQESRPYQLEFRPGAFRDIYGRSADSTLVFEMNIASRKTYGNILLNISGLDSAHAYILELLISENTVAQTRLLPAGATGHKLEFNTLFPQAYSLRIVEDRNANGIWDSGSYDAKRQPERIFSFKLEPLRANWDLEAEVKVE